MKDFSKCALESVKDWYVENFLRDGLISLLEAPIETYEAYKEVACQTSNMQKQMEMVYSSLC